MRLVKAAPAAPMAQEPGLPPAAAASPFGADTAPPDTPSTTPLADRAAASATQSAPLPTPPSTGVRWPAELERRLERHLDRALTPLRARAAQSAGDTAAGLDDAEAAEAPRISQTFNVRLTVGAAPQAGGLAAWQAGDACGDALRDAALRQGLMP
ncbi:hypothetical protein [Azohydromonas caseinilytica]|uniref:Uncharacterized protein n=1 Tax=Azohydromonas caseinilytica TaxID=2728836 RepID=A0A848F5W1_9BURK|nr:hypothetical protein [Azohydromonas caseinilytica]NML13680.1 hypothetical protein [Azohydromonas caseinilytica]